jgi:hypothetical protein
VRENLPVFTTPATNGGCPICPDFLRRLVALIHSMRLSFLEGAHAGISGTAWQEIGVKPFSGLSGIMALDLPLPVCNARVREVKSPHKGTGLSDPWRAQLRNWSSHPDSSTLGVLGKVLSALCLASFRV